MNPHREYPAEDLLSKSIRAGAWWSRVRPVPYCHSRYLENPEGPIASEYVVKKHVRLLLTEDDSFECTVVTKMLEAGKRIDVEIDTASRLSAAVKALQSSSYDIVLLDLGLPDSRGIETFRTVSSVAVDTPIVVLTAADQPEMELQLIREGAQDYLSKSELSIAMLERIILHGLERHGLLKDLSSSLAAQRSAHRRFEVLLKESLDGLVVVSPEGTIAYTNPSAQRILENRSLSGEKLPFELPPEDAVAEEAYTDSVGECHILEVRATPVTWENRRMHLVFLRDITEMKRARETIEGLSRFPEENPHPVFRVTRNFKILYANDAAIQTFHLERERLGTKIPEKLRAQVEESFRTGYEFKFKIKQDGRVFFFSIVLISQYSYANLYGTDITETEQAQEETKRAQENLRAIVQNMPVMLAALDEENRFVAWNSECERVTGYVDSEMFSSREALQRLFPDQELSDTTLDAWNHRGLPLRNKILQLRTRQGEVRHVSWSDISAQYPIPGWASWGVGIDVTAESNFRTELLRERDLVSHIMETSPVGILVTDEQGRITFINRSAAEALGDISENLLGRRYNDARFEVTDSNGRKIPEDHLPFRVLQKNRERLTDQRISICCANGSMNHLSVNGTPLLSPDGMFTGGVFTLADITRDVLSARERERINEQNRRRQKLEAVGQLAGGIAHDFNNILGGISGYADLVKFKYGGSDPKLRSYIEKILESTMAAADLTRQLLAFARKGEVDKMPCDIHECIRRVVTMLSHTVDRRIVIRREFRAEESIVNGNNAQIESALLNLGINARDAMPGGGELFFSTNLIEKRGDSVTGQELQLDNGTYIHVRVGDTGTGMDQETAERIFEPFFTTKETGKGTGLGLSGVYGTVQGHGGAIWVDTKPGNGSVFNILLPLTVHESKLPRKSEARPVNGTGTVLVIDDDDKISESLVQILQNLGYQAVRSADGYAGAEYYRDHWKGIDAVILDLIMPRTSGVDCLKELRAINPQVLVLIASGYGHSEQVLGLGVGAFLSKPFRMNQIATALHSLLNGTIRSNGVEK